MNKNRNFRKTLCIVLLAGVVGLNLSFGHSLNHLFHPKIARAFDDVKCLCPVLSGNHLCTSNNFGGQCAPEGTTQCSIYNSNCEG